jgi:hypothetical protein
MVLSALASAASHGMPYLVASATSSNVIPLAIAAGTPIAPPRPIAMSRPRVQASGSSAACRHSDPTAIPRQ